MRDWRLAHAWLRGLSDARLGKNRAACYTAEARAYYERGHSTVLQLEKAA